MSRVFVADKYGKEIIPGAIPSLRLADEGGGEAYFVPSDTEPRRIPGIWYLKDAPRYVSPTGEYQQVTVFRERDETPW